MNHLELLIESLEIASEKKGDLTQSIYDIYFEKCPESKELMWHVDQLVLGKMIAEVMRLLMLDDYDTESAYLEFETRTHRQSYGVLRHMYGNLMESITLSVQEAVGNDWNKNYQEAWRNRTTELLTAVDRQLGH